MSLQVNPYLSFKGDCEAAFALYARVFGGEVGHAFRYSGSPMAHLVPAAWDDKIMHGSVTIGGLVLMGADVAPDSYEAPRGVSLSIQPATVDDAERIFRELADGGRVTAPLEQTFWAERFGMLVDRFGVTWMLNFGGEAQV